MATKKLKPMTAGTRHRVAPDYRHLDKVAPEKSLTEGLNKSGGRNVNGRITSRHRGGGHKRRYRIIDFKRDKFDIPATVKTIEYDPNRSAFIALLAYVDGEKRYIIAPDKLKVGDKVISGKEVVPDTGNAMPLRKIPTGTFVHCIELSPGLGAKIARSAGTNAQLVAKTEKYATLKMPSSEQRNVLIDCMATVGVTSNTDHFNVTDAKAGRKRWKGQRPQTRGVAMNPIDHPMGGGEGKASGGHPRSPWGQMAKGLKTRDKNNPSSKLIIRRRKVKK